MVMADLEALSVIHAGRGAEQTGAGSGQIWSHKSQITKKMYVTNNSYALTYLTVPEDSRLGVITHELGHFFLNGLIYTMRDQKIQ